MSGPITWQNINAPDLSRSLLGLSLAGNTITQGLQGLGNAVNDYYKVEDGKQLQGFLERVNQARTPEEVAAMQSSGELDALRAALPERLLGATRNADQARLDSLYQRQGIDQQREDAAFARGRMLDDRAHQGTTDAVASLIAQNKLPEAAQMVGGATGLPDSLSARLYSSIASADTANKNNSLNTELNQQKVDKGKQEIEAGKRTATLGDMEVNQAIKAKNENELSEQVYRSLDTQAKQHQKNTFELRNSVTAAARDLKLPLEKDGSLNLNLLTSDHRKQLETKLATQGLEGGLNRLESGDSAYREASVQRVRDEFPNAPEAMLRQAMDKANPVFSTVRSAPIGVDAEAIVKKKAELELATSRYNQQYGGIISTPGETQSSGEVVSDYFTNVLGIKDTDTGRYRDMIRALNRSITQDGIDMGDGQVFTPGPKAIQQILNGMSWDRMDFIAISDIENRVKESYQRWKKDPRTLEAAKQYSELSQVSTGLGLTGGVTAGDPQKLGDTLKAADKKSKDKPTSPATAEDLQKSLARTAQNNVLGRNLPKSPGRKKEED